MSKKLSKIKDYLKERTRTLKDLCPSSGGGASVSALPAQAMEKLIHFFKNTDLSEHGKLLTIILCSYFLSDLSALLISRFIPEPTQNKQVTKRNFGNLRSNRSKYDVIFGRNLFNSKGLIPTEEKEKPKVADNTPVKTTLPIELLGTIVFEKKKFSLATLNDRGSSKVYPVRAGDEIPQMLKIESIEDRKVIFVNLRSRQKEFVDMPEDVKFKPAATGKRGKKQAIQTTAPNNFIVPRTEIDEAVSDLSKILTQARVVPVTKEGVTKFKIFQIVAGSIYDKLGLKNGDLLVAINGEPIDPSKAFTLLQELKNLNSVEVTYERNGQAKVNSYDIQ